MDLDGLFNAANVVAVGTAVAATVVSALGAAGASGFLRRLGLGNSESDTSVERSTLRSIQEQIAKSNTGPPVPFEIEQLAGYYALTLGQARVSFWFSLVFASIGFVVIMSAAVFYSGGDYVSASIKVISGLVIDAVSALFFVQSRRAQDSMSAFFEKLRSDRQFVEARKICDEITDEGTKNDLKTILVLHYSGIDTSSVVSSLTANRILVHNS